jgi:hypothetical protein
MVASASADLSSYALQGQNKPARRNAAGNSQQPINALKGQYILVGNGELIVE